MTTTSFTTATELSPSRRWVAVGLCWLLIVFDGYDLIVYGVVQNDLIEKAGWDLTAASAGTVGSLAFVGMMIGAVSAGRIADALGRRRAILACAVIFSAATVACAFAISPAMFGLLRLIAGIGLGGLVPSANALTSELVPDRWRGSMATLMMSGVPIGGTIAALVGLVLLPMWGWRSMFAVAALSFIVVIAAFVLLPETSPRPAPADRAASPRAGFDAVLRSPWLVSSVLFAVATLFTLFAWYGLGTQLPKIMRDSGTDLGSALTFTIALNIGAVLGSIVTAWAGDRWGLLRVSAIAAGLAGVSLLVLMSGTTHVALTYAALTLAGVGTHGTQALIIGAVASRYPDHLRGTALGWTMGVGRIGAVLAPQLSGLLLAAPSIPPAINFLLFGGAAITAAGVLIALSAHRPDRATSAA